MVCSPKYVIVEYNCVTKIKTWWSVERGFLPDEGDATYFDNFAQAALYLQAEHIRYCSERNIIYISPTYI